MLDDKAMNVEIPNDFAGLPPVTRHIFISINHLLKGQPARINKIHHSQFMEHYTFSNEIESVSFQIYYNAQNKVSSIIKPAKTSDFSEYLYDLLIPLINKTFILSNDVTENPAVSFKFEDDFQKNFFEQLKNKLQSSHFYISKIEHKPYHEIYEIKKDGHTATYKFWYEGKKHFKKTEIISSRTTGLTNEINKLL